MKIGVLALQGAFREHRQMLEQCGADVIEVRKPEDVEQIDGLIIPGGESTTIGKLLVEWGLAERVKARAQQGMPIFGTCAGLIVVAKEIIGYAAQPRLGLIDIAAQRNAYGRQVDSFEHEFTIPELGDMPFKAVFIRAPYIDSYEPSVQVLAEHEGKVIFARQKNILVASFHPELTGDDRIHRYFLKMVQDSAKKDAKDKRA
ncbi:MAG TPA: pyridoxal 5'-phosphate synthase glutaminase subunit PdxT [Firmicutes bacterium]|nr:pyridoxal 5'-phosphate synthase glutaminase subunit PdxT [Bacillota bacterium]